MICSHNDCLNCPLPRCKHDVPDFYEEYVRERKRETSRKWDAEHREYCREKSKAWYQDPHNREHHKKRCLANYYKRKEARAKAK